jgi:hypothetical protein
MAMTELVLIQLEELRDYIEMAGYEIIYRDLHGRHPLLEGFVSLKFKKVFIDISVRNTRQEKCVLAEELGHVLLPPAVDGALYHFAEYKDVFQTQWERDSLEISVAKDERRALRYGTSILIPDQAFWDYAKSKHMWYEWYEYFEVEDWFMRAKFEFMQTKQHFKWRDLVIINSAAERRFWSLKGGSTFFD